jgi:hypothetical protein
MARFLKGQTPFLAHRMPLEEARSRALKPAQRAYGTALPLPVWAAKFLCPSFKNGWDMLAWKRLRFIWTYPAMRNENWHPVFGLSEGLFRGVLVRVLFRQENWVEKTSSYRRIFPSEKP